MSISIIDLFCGVGGLSRGIVDSGLKVDAGFDLDESCRYAYEHNTNANFINCDISKTPIEIFAKQFDDGECRAIVGCAPCQPFSTCTPKHNSGVKNSKWNLLNNFTRIVDELNPEIVSMENVPQIVGTEPFIEFIEVLEKNGYFIDYSIINCEDYGIPQKRKRLVLTASVFGQMSVRPPAKITQHNVWDAIGKLPPLQDGETSKDDPLHCCQKLSELNKKRILNSVPGGTWVDWPEDLVLECHKKTNGKSYKSAYGRMEWFKPSPTITTEFYNYGSGRFGHPEQNRALSLREGALLQTFPYDYEFTPNNKITSISKTATHIGNAVPVLLGKAIGMAIKDNIKKYGYNG